MALRGHSSRFIAVLALRGIALCMVYCLAALLFPTDAAAKEKGTKEWLMAGVRPATDDDFSGLDLANVREAQDLRQTVAGVIELLSGQEIAGHDEVRRTLSDAYLVSQFDCGNKTRCLTKLFRPLTKLGYRQVVLGTYVVNDDLITIRIDILSLKSGSIVDSITTSLPRSKVGDPTSWVEPLQPLFSNVGTVRLQVNVEGFELTVDGKPRELDEKGTLTLSPGLHLLEVSKKDYQSTQLPVTIKKGKLTPVALALAPLPKISDYISNGQLDFQSLAKDKKGQKKVLSLNGATGIMYKLDRNNKKAGGEAGATFANFVFTSSNGPLSLVYVYEFFSSGVRGAWLGIDFSKKLSANIGIIPVNLSMPFFAAYGQSITWNQGFGNDNDAGVDLTYSTDRFRLRLAYFVSDEFSLFGGSGRIDRSAPDIVVTGDQVYQERHLGVGSAFVKLGGEKHYVNLEVTGSYGGIFNASNQEYGRRWSVAGVADAYFGPLVLAAQVIRYRFAPVNDVGAPVSTINMGQFNFVAEMASHGTWLESTFRYTTGLKKGRLRGLHIHGGHAQLLKVNKSFHDSIQVVLGTSIELGELTVFVNGIVSKNAPGSEDPEFRSLGQGYADARWLPETQIFAVHSFSL